MSKKRKLSQEELNSMIEQHTLFLYTNGQEGKRAIFEDMDLNGLDFGYMRLEELDFDNVSFNKAKFFKAELVDSTFKNCTLHDADFTSAYMKDTALYKVKGNRTKFDNSDISCVIIGECEFKECSFRDVSMDYSSIYDTGIKDCKMYNAILYKNCFDIMSFDGSNMKDAFVLKCNI